MADGVKLIVGLGNPTAQYEKTRHNAGFWFLDELSRQLGVALRPESRFLGMFGRTDVGGQPLYLLKPSTYMNRSGQSVAAGAGYYKVAPGEILVVHDELDLSPGAVRLKFGGGHGGHNGLKDIISHIRSPDFLRLRLGIGHPGDRSQVSNFVLSAPSRAESDCIGEAMGRALGEMAAILRGGAASVMNRLNSAGSTGDLANVKKG